MQEKILATEAVPTLESIRAMLAAKNRRIITLESALPTLGGGLVAEAVMFYLIALNTEYFAACKALAEIAGEAHENNAEAVAA
ncbi:hypothetical protein [Paraburkholderia ferrariae]|uniref:hypothetical protein n=1 Tax=Paraburkholderia ferrariae TaxID=386056 RepID=UPI00047F1A93|nr:hypothetical protein [Paraburkholderia ferrariae]